MQRPAAVAGLEQRRAAAFALGAAEAQLGRAGQAPSTGAVGMRLSIALTTPPTALPPYSSAAGPRSTSMRSTTSGSIGTAWSKLRLEASNDAPALLEHAHAVAVEAADHRPVGVRAEVGGRDAGLAGERLAERAAAAQHQLVAGQHRHRRGQVGRAQRVAGDDHRSRAGWSGRAAAQRRRASERRSASAGAAKRGTESLT